MTSIPELQASLKHVTEAVQRHPDTPRCQARLGEALLLRGRTEEAIEPLRLALCEQSPPRDFYLLSYAFLCLGHHSSADRFASQAVNASPAFCKAWYIRGRARLALGRHVEAVENFLMAAGLGTNPEYRLAAARLIVNHRRGGEDQRRRAIALLEAVRENPAVAAEADGLLNLLAAPSPKADAPGAFAALRSASHRMNTDTPGVTETETPRDAWPAPTDARLGLLDHDVLAIMPPPVAPGEIERAFDESWVDSWDTPKRGPHSVTELERLLQEGRRHIRAGRHDEAITRLEEGWGIVRRCTKRDPAHASLFQRLAEALSVTYVHTPDARRVITADELFRHGARYVPFLAYLARCVLAEHRQGPAGLDILVTAIELDAFTDPRELDSIMRTLANMLRPDLSSSESVGEASEELLVRLHRKKPSLAFPRLYLGYRRYQQHDFDAAAALFSGIGGRLSTEPRLLLLRARCADRLGDTPSATALYRETAAQRRAQPHAHLDIGCLLVAATKERCA